MDAQEQSYFIVEISNWKTIMVVLVITDDAKTTDPIKVVFWRRMKFFILILRKLEKRLQNYWSCSWHQLFAPKKNSHWCYS